MEVRFTQAARRHRIGRAHAHYVMANTKPATTTTSRGEARFDWVGEDDRGIELEITAVRATDLRSGEPVLLVLHVMPTALRRN